MRFKPRSLLLALLAIATTRHASALSMKKQMRLKQQLDAARAAKTGTPHAADNTPKTPLTAMPPAPKPRPQKPQPKKRAISPEEVLAAVRNAAATDASTAATSAATPRRAPPRPSTAAVTTPRRKPAVDEGEQYKQFDAMLSTSREGRNSRVRSTELIPKNTPLPMPPTLAELPGHPFSVDSLTALASWEEGGAAASRLVLIASTSPMLDQTLRQTLVDFSSTFPKEKLDAQVAAVSRVPPSGYRKLARKGGVHFTLLSDESSAWLSKLGCAPGDTCAFVVSMPGCRVVASFSAADEPTALVARVTSMLETTEVEVEEPSVAVAEATLEAAAVAPDAELDYAAWAAASEVESSTLASAGAASTAAPPQSARADPAEQTQLRKLKEENDSLRAALSRTEEAKSEAAQQQELLRRLEAAERAQLTAAQQAAELKLAVQAEATRLAAASEAAQKAAEAAATREVNAAREAAAKAVAAAEALAAARLAEAEEVRVLEVAEREAAEMAKEEAIKAVEAARVSTPFAANITFRPKAQLKEDFEELVRDAGRPSQSKRPPPMGAASDSRRMPRPRSESRERGRAPTRGASDGGEAREAGYKFIYLPDLKMLASMLNSTAGVKCVTSSRISASAPAAVPPEDSNEPLTVAVAGHGQRGAIRLLARGGGSWRAKTQRLFVELEDGVSEDALDERLRALARLQGFNYVSRGLDAVESLPTPASEDELSES